MTQADEDYGDFVEKKAPSNELLARINKLVVEQLKAEAAVAAAEAALEKAEANLKDIAERRLPQLMDEAQMEEFVTSTGVKVQVGEVIRGSIPEEKRPQGFAWLRDNGQAGMIRRVVMAEFGVGKDEQAEALFKRLQEEHYSVLDKADVNAQTFSAFVRERLREGKPVPTDIFSIYRQRVSKVALPKERNKKR